MLWQAADGYAGSSGVLLPFEMSFLVLPIVLHRETRESLPKVVRTSLAVWIEQNPLARPRIGDRARALVRFTKEAIMYGGLHGLLEVGSDGGIGAKQEWKKRIAGDLKDSSDEVRLCAKRAAFVGRWLAGSGTPDTVMAILGVRP